MEKFGLVIFGTSEVGSTKASLIPKPLQKVERGYFPKFHLKSWLVITVLDPNHEQSYF